MTHHFHSHSHLPELTFLSLAQLQRRLRNVNDHCDPCSSLFVFAHYASFALSSLQAGVTNLFFLFLSVSYPLRYLYMHIFCHSRKKKKTNICRKNAIFLEVPLVQNLSNILSECLQSRGTI